MGQWADSVCLEHSYPGLILGCIYNTLSTAMSDPWDQSQESTLSIIKATNKSRGKR